MRIKHRLRNNKFKALMICVAMVWCMMISTSAFCASPTSGIITFSTSATSSVSVYLYKVASIDERGGLSVDEKYQKYSINFDETTAARTIEAYIERDGLAADVERKTTDGSCAFERLEKGLYLLCADGQELAEENIQIMPSLISVPQMSDGEEYWNINVDAKEEPIITQTDLTVTKVWEGQDPDAESLPTSIIVQLLKDGNVVDEQTLSEENAWTYKWTSLESSSKWSILEKSVPKDYAVGIEESENVTTITNAYMPDGHYYDNDDDDDDSGDDDNSSNENSSSSESDNGSSSGDKLRQTGPPWIPVVLMAVFGAVLLFVGLCLKEDR